jgi:uncharacterized protein DUF2190
MSTVGTLVRFPGIVSVPIQAAAATGATAILRGMLVVIDGTTFTARQAALADAHIHGVALSDADPDILSVPVAVMGGYTVSLAPIAGQTFNVGTPVYQDQTAGGGFKVTAAATAGKIIGWCVNPQPDSLGNIEVALFTMLET